MPDFHHNLVVAQIAIIAGRHKINYRPRSCERERNLRIGAVTRQEVDSRIAASSWFLAIIVFCSSAFSFVRSAASC